MSVSYRVNREGTMVMYSAEGSSAVIEPNPIHLGFKSPKLPARRR